MRKSKKTWDCVVGLLVGAALLAGGALAEGTALAQARGKTETLTGIVSDTMCGAKHHPGMEDQTKQCIIGCVKSMKAKYALVVGDKVYTLEGREVELEKLAGGKAKVTGTLQGTTIRVTSVSSVI